jgi:hypothetical protein
MNIRYKCGLDDYREAQNVALRKSASYYFVLSGGVLCLLLGIVHLALTGSISSSLPEFSLAVFSLAYPFVYPHFKLKRDFDKHPNFGRECLLDVDEDGLRSESDVSTGEAKWAAFVKFHETSNLFMLYLSGSTFKVIPKRAFSALQLEEFRELLHRRLSAQ